MASSPAALTSVNKSGRDGNVIDFLLHDCHDHRDHGHDDDHEEEK